MGLTNLVKRLLPTAFAESSPRVPLRMGKYGEVAVNVDNAWRAANEGTFYVGQNAALDTPVATTTSITGYDATKPVFVLINGGSKNIEMQYLRLLWGQVPTSAAEWHWSGEVDPLTTRYSSAGTSVTPVKVNADGVASGATVYIGAPVLTAAGSGKRQLFHAYGRSVIPVINDEVYFGFGQLAMAPPSTLGGTVAMPICLRLPPVLIAPNETFAIMGWGASNGAAPSWEYDFGFIER